MGDSRSTLLGFDVREMWNDPGLTQFEDGSVWNRQLKEHALFRPEVKRPLSVDPMIWPSVFDVVENLSRPKWVGPIQSLWEDLFRMETCLAGWACNRKRSWVVAVSVLWESCLPIEQEQWQARLSRTNPAEIRKEWTLLGFDVADAYLMSELTNGSVSADCKELKDFMIDSLNTNYLFNGLPQAFEFKRIADSRNVLHAPFFIYGLWLLKEIGSGKD